MRILVTGGAGFIGSALIRQLIGDSRDEILNLDKLTYAANLDNLKLVVPSPRYRFQHADIADGAAVTRAIAEFQPDAIVNLAAESHVDRSIDAPAAFIQTNIVGTYTLLEAARTYWQALPHGRRQQFRFHHVSTDEVFGSLGPTGAFDEETPYAPNSPYSASKAGSDMLVRAWHTTYGLPVLTTNCSNNYGPYQFLEKLIPVTILAALEGRPIPVYGTGNNVRDWLYVEDHAAALLKVLRGGIPGETYAIGGGCEMTNLALVTMVCRILDELRPSNTPRERLINFVADRPGHDKRYAIDSSKIERELGWTPSVTIEDGLRATVAWYLDNEWWWRAVRERGYKGDRIGIGASVAGA